MYISYLISLPREPEALCLVLSFHLLLPDQELSCVGSLPRDGGCDDAPAGPAAQEPTPQPVRPAPGGPLTTLVPTHTHHTPPLLDECSEMTHIAVQHPAPHDNMTDAAPQVDPSPKIAPKAAAELLVGSTGCADQCSITETKTRLERRLADLKSLVFFCRSIP